MGLSSVYVWGVSQLWDLFFDCCYGGRLSSRITLKLVLRWGSFSADRDFLNFSRRNFISVSASWFCKMMASSTINRFHFPDKQIDNVYVHTTLRNLVENLWPETQHSILQLNRVVYVWPFFKWCFTLKRRLICLTTCLYWTDVACAKSQ